MAFVYKGKTYSRTLKIFHTMLCYSAFLTGMFKNIWNRYNQDQSSQAFSCCWEFTGKASSGKKRKAGWRKEDILMKGIGIVQKQENLPVRTISCFIDISEFNASLKSICRSTELYGRITINIKD